LSDLTWVFKCNKCAKPMLFWEKAGFDAGEEHVVVMCVKCENTGVKARIEAMTDKSVVRCTKCGAWKIESGSCYTCKKTNALSV
jgi:DNA-directed RNA polymerase subunit RPC12/RpoP